MSPTPILYCEDGSEIALPFKWTICPHCDGHGKSSAYLGAYTSSEMDAAGPEFLSAYMAGDYDRRCDDCGGDGKVRVADKKGMTRAQRSEWAAQCKADREFAAEVAAERRMGC